MVQEARLDLIAAAALLLLGATSPGLAQPLTTLLKLPLARPDRLSGPDRLANPAPLTTMEPLMPFSPLAGPGPAGAAGKPGDPCYRRPAGSLSAGGSGPGEFGRFMPNGGEPTPATGPAPSIVTTQPGADRPLWSEDSSLMPSRPAAAPPAGVTTSSSTSVPSAGSSVPAPPMDRPLWATGGPVKPCVERTRPGQTPP